MREKWYVNCKGQQTHRAQTVGKERKREDEHVLLLKLFPRHDVSHEAETTLFEFVWLNRLVDDGNGLANEMWRFTEKNATSHSSVWFVLYRLMIKVSHQDYNHFEFYRIIFRFVPIRGLALLTRKRSPRAWRVLSTWASGSVGRAAGWTSTGPRVWISPCWRWSCLPPTSPLLDRGSTRDVSRSRSLLKLQMVRTTSLSVIFLQSQP